MSEAPHRGYSIFIFFTAAIMAISSVYSCLGDDLDQRFSKGLEFLYENHYEDAESHFLMFAREMARSDDPEAKHWQAKALFEIGRIDHLYLDQPHRAVAQLRKALKLYPDSPFSFDARKEIADILYDRIMDYRTSALEYERLVHDFSRHKGIDAYQYRVAQSYFLVRDFDQARTEARLLLTKWPDGRFAQEARLLIANSYYLQNRLTEAIKAHRELLDSNPDVPLRARSLFELGICYQDLGKKDKAEEAFIAALKDHPRPDLVQMQLAALRDRIKNEDLATKPLAYPTEPAVSSLSKNKISPSKRSRPKQPSHSTQLQTKHEKANATKTSPKTEQKDKQDSKPPSVKKADDTATGEQPGSKKQKQTSQKHEANPNENKAPEAKSKNATTETESKTGSQ